MFAAENVILDENDVHVRSVLHPYSPCKYVDHHEEGRLLARVVVLHDPTPLREKERVHDRPAASHIKTTC